MVKNYFLELYIYIHIYIYIYIYIYKESFWQHKLQTFVPNGLNEREVCMV